MSDQPNTDPSLRPRVAVVHARGHRRRRLSWIWAIPLVTALIGAWLVWHTLDERGPLITVTFATAEGLTANQSKVRHKEVEMGSVERIDLSPDLKGVIVTIRMTKQAAPLVTDQAIFWVVKPRFFAGSVSGLQTVLSGAYIEIRPGATRGAPKYAFVGEENPPVLRADAQGTTFRLTSPRIGSLSLGSPIFFRDQLVGEVLGWNIGEMAENVTILAFVRDPFDKYVRDATRFWNASGLSVELGAKGLQIHLESVRALLLGGIAFDTPQEGLSTPLGQVNQTFPLHASKEAADSAIYFRSPTMAAIFHGSVLGLGPGAPVRLRGLTIGEVESVNLEYDSATDNVVAVARFFVEPNRIAASLARPDAPVLNRLAQLVQRGLRVKLDSGSLLTGSKTLSLDLYPNAQPATLSTRGGAIVVPVIEGSGDPIASAAALMDKLGSIPFDEIGRNLNDTLAGTSTLVNDPDFKAVADVLRETLRGVQGFIATLNRGVEPVTQKLPALATHLDEALKRTDRLIASIEAGYGSNSQLNRDANRLMVQLSEAARSIRVLADLLARNPEALIRGRTSQGP